MELYIVIQQSPNLTYIVILKRYAVMLSRSYLFEYGIRYDHIWTLIKDGYHAQSQRCEGL